MSRQTTYRLRGKETRKWRKAHEAPVAHQASEVFVVSWMQPGMVSNPSKTQSAVSEGVDEGPCGPSLKGRQRRHRQPSAALLSMQFQKKCWWIAFGSLP